MGQKQKVCLFCEDSLILFFRPPLVPFTLCAVALDLSWTIDFEGCCRWVVTYRLLSIGCTVKMKGHMGDKCALENQ